MGEYRLIHKDEDRTYLAHYGVKGMKWDKKFRKHTDDFYKKIKRGIKGGAGYLANRAIDSAAKAYDKEYGEQDSRTYDTNPKSGKYEIKNKGWNKRDKAKAYVKNKIRDAGYAAEDAVKAATKKKTIKNIIKEGLRASDRVLGKPDIYSAYKNWRKATKKQRKSEKLRRLFKKHGGSYTRA